MICSPFISVAVPRPVFGLPLYLDSHALDPYTVAFFESCCGVMSSAFFLRGVRRACFIKLTVGLLQVVLEDVPPALLRVPYMRNLSWRRWPGKALF